MGGFDPIAYSLAKKAMLRAMQDLAAHRLSSPLDHPDGSITTAKMADGNVTRAKLEYPTVDVNFAYLAAIGKTKGAPQDIANRYAVITITSDSFADKAVDAWIWDRWGMICCRYNQNDRWYRAILDDSQTTADYRLDKRVADAYIVLGSEAVDITAQYAYLLRISASGSTLKAYRAEPTSLADSADADATPKVSVTDTSFASGYWGPGSHLYGGGHSEAAIAWLRAPSSPSLPAQAVLELSLEGSGRPEEPFRPAMSKSLVEISTLTGLPDFLYAEARKYDILRAKGFTDDEIKVILGYIPQHQVDLDAVTFGSFELHPDKAPTAIVTITGDNPYKSGAIDRQKAKAKRVFAPPTTYDDAVSLYNTLKKDYPHWLAGKDNMAYQTLGLEVFDWLQNTDFYYGELIEHKTHYSQLKQVPDFEMRNHLNELIEKLSKVSVLVEERDKHVAKAKEILRRGW